MSAWSQGRLKLCVQAALIVAIGLILSGCGSLSLFKSHKDEPGASEPYPNLSSVPERPEEKESAADRRKIAEGLVAERTQVQYTDQVLRGGTEASAPPPPPPVAELPEATAGESTGSTAASEDQTEEEEERPGFFGRLLGSKKDKRSEAETSTEALPAPSAEETQPAAEAPQASPEESTGATEVREDQSAESKRGFFRRLFGSKKSGETSDPSREAQPALPDPAAAPSASPAAAQ
jgi:hypothetical protein